jgi:hypothetical protein
MADRQIPTQLTVLLKLGTYLYVLTKLFTFSA